MSTNIQIYYPELLTRGQRVRDTFLTALMWCIYVYLWMPLVSLLAWLAGLEFAYDVMVRAGGASALLSVLAWYTVVVSVIFVVVTVWSVSNRLRFRNRDRRRGVGSPGDQTLAEYFGLGLDQLDLMRRNRIMKLEFDQGGRPILVGQQPRNHWSLDSTAKSAAACGGGLPARAVRKHE